MELEQLKSLAIAANLAYDTLLQIRLTLELAGCEVEEDEGQIIVFHPEYADGKTDLSVD